MKSCQESCQDMFTLIRSVVERAEMVARDQQNDDRQTDDQQADLVKSKQHTVNKKATWSHICICLSHGYIHIYVLADMHT